MISIRQDRCDLSRVGLILSRTGTTTIRLNVDMIDDDLEKLRRMEREAYKKSDKDNINYIKKTLYNIASNLRDGDTISMAFQYDAEKCRITSFPLELPHFNLYGIKTTDYLAPINGHVIHIDYSNVFKIMLFDMMYREFEFSLGSIENILSHIGVITIVDESEIMGIIEDKIIDLSKVMKITDSPYATKDCKMSWDYFSYVSNNSTDCAFLSNNYRECTSMSINLANTIIVRNLAEKFQKANIKFNIVSVNDDGFYIYIPDDNIDAVKNEIESISVRAFGRKFEVVPKVTVY